MKKKLVSRDRTEERVVRLEEPVAELAPAREVTQTKVQSAWPLRTTVNVRTAKDQISALLERASEGEEIVITSDGRPEGMLVRYRPQAEGQVAGSMAALRRAMTQTPDSTAQIRAERDAGF
jgi:prevent-host-death family protein